jgi:hypothetical protein
MLNDAHSFTMVLLSREYRNNDKVVGLQDCYSELPCTFMEISVHQLFNCVAEFFCCQVLLVSDLSTVSVQMIPISDRYQFDYSA